MVEPSTIIDGLLARGVPYHAAVALAGNMAIESRFDPTINEISPLVPGSRGGYGLMQWTGPRRKQYEAYSQGRGDSLDTQLDFLVHELGTTESAARDAIFGAADPIEAARLVSEKYLRPGIPHLDARLEATRSLLGGSGDQWQGQAPETGQNRPDANAMAQMQPRGNALPVAPQFNALDPAAFQRQIPQNALYGFTPGTSPYIQG